MLKIKVSKPSEKFIVRLPAKQQRQIALKLLALRSNPAPVDAKPLKGSHYMRADVGEYRIIYNVGEDVLMIVLSGKRNDDDIYKKLKRLF